MFQAPPPALGQHIFFPGTASRQRARVQAGGTAAPGGRSQAGGRRLHQHVPGSTAALRQHVLFPCGAARQRTRVQTGGTPASGGRSQAGARRPACSRLRRSPRAAHLLSRHRLAAARPSSESRAEPTSPPVAPPKQEPGDFTRVFQAPPQFPRAAHLLPPAPPRGSAPVSPAGKDDAGAFTRMLWISPLPAVSAAGGFGPHHSQENDAPGEFTRMFQDPGLQSARASAAL